MTQDTGSSVVVGLIQAKDLGDREKNIEHHIELIAQAVERGAQIVCMQELFATDYFCQVEDPALFDLAEPIPGPTTERMREVAIEHGIVLIVPVFEKRTRGLYFNSAVVIDADGTFKGTYRKMHIPHDPNFYEKYYFTPGDLGFRAFDTKFGRIGVLICWDQWYPEGARITALRGADILFYPTCIGYADPDEPVWKLQRDSWQLAQRAHALANGVYVCAPNRVGREGNVTFWGSSFISDPFGHKLAEASQSDEEVLVAKLELDHIEDNRRAWPFLRDRRTDAYGPITSRYLDDVDA